MAHMKTPQYRSNLQQLLEQEKVRADVSLVIVHGVICETFCHCGPHLACIVCFSFFLPMQQKHRDLSGQAEQLHSVCQAHKDKIKGLFQAKLDEVRFAALLHH